jgi:hypothetical protein
VRAYLVRAVLERSVAFAQLPRTSPPSPYCHSSI